MNYEIRYVRGHVEVYDQMGRFRFSADSEWEALEELKKDQYILDVLGPHVSKAYISGKEKEWEEYRTQVSEWERRKYLGNY